MALAAGENYRSGAFVRGIPQDTFFADKNFSSLFKVVEGRLDLPDFRTAVIGEKNFRAAWSSCWRQYKIISMNTAGKRFVPKVAQLKVGGIISSGYQELDSLWVLFQLKRLLILLQNHLANLLLELKLKILFPKNFLLLQSESKLLHFKMKGLPIPELKHGKKSMRLNLKTLLQQKLC